MEKRCAEANEQSLTPRMARYPNWRQVDALTSAALATMGVAPFRPDDPQFQKIASNAQLGHPSALSSLRSQYWTETPAVPSSCAQATDAAAPVSGIFSFVPDSGINAAAFKPS
jgi:hypothetical protein